MFRILEKAVRIPHEVTGDLMAQVAAINIGTREWQQLAERHGPETLLAAQDNLLEYTEKLTRAAIRELPEGSWTFSDYIDDDGISDETIKIQATITRQPLLPLPPGVRESACILGLVVALQTAIEACS